MKVILLLASLALAFNASASDSTGIPRLTMDDVRDSHYNAGELSFDGFALGRLQQVPQVTYGGGLGANWFPFRAAGLGIAVRSEDTEHSFIDDLDSKLIARLPWNRFALNFGIGSTFNFERDKWSVFAEAGPEVRIRQGVGLFGTIRGVRPIAGADGEHVLVMVGVRIKLTK